MLNYVKIYYMSVILGGKNMNKWEDKYNKINPVIDNMISEQAAKMNEARRKQAELGKDVDSQEYKQAKADLKDAKMQKENLDKLKPNLKKVSNYIAIRKQIEARQNEYRKVRNAQNEIINNRRQIGKCDQLEKEATEEIKNLTEKLRSGKLTETKKIEVNKKITEAANKKQNAFNLRNQLNEKNNSLNDGLKELKYGEIDRNTLKEQMDQQTLALEELDKKCEQLMDGENVEYTYQQAMSKKDNELEQPETTGRDEQDDRLFDDNFILKDNTNTKTDDMEYEDISSKSTFADRHPGLAKIGNFFKNLKDKVFNRNKTPELEEGTLKETKGIEEKIEEIAGKEQIELTDKEMDRLVQDIIKDVDEVGKNSEKGIESLRDSIKVTLSEEAKARLAKLREDNGYRQGDTGPTMTQKGKAALNRIDRTAQEINDGGREPGE